MVSPNLARRNAAHKYVRRNREQPHLLKNRQELSDDKIFAMLSTYRNYITHKDPCLQNGSAKFPIVHCAALLLRSQSMWPECVFQSKRVYCNQRVLHQSGMPASGAKAGHQLSCVQSSFLSRSLRTAAGRALNGFEPHAVGQGVKAGGKNNDSDRCPVPLGA